MAPTIFNIPNALTVSRVLLIPVFFYLYKSGYHAACLMILLISVLTDFFDGYFARRLDQATDFGAILDPICDKFFVLVYFAHLVYAGLVPAWIGAIYLARNFSQLMSIPILSWWLKKTFKVKPKWQPKWAAALSFVLIPILYFQHILVPSLPFEMKYILWIILAPSLLLEVYVFLTYIPRLIQIGQGTHDTFE